MFGHNATASEKVETPASDPSTNKTNMNRSTPFRLGSWIRLHGVDLITMALMGAVGLGIYEARKYSY